MRRRVTLKEIRPQYPVRVYLSNIREVFYAANAASVVRFYTAEKVGNTSLPPYYYITLLVKKQILTQQKVSIYYENVFIFRIKFLDSCQMLDVLSTQSNTFNFVMRHPSA